MSIDLSRPLVPSMGQHDPLDGYITIMQLRFAPAALAEGTSGPDLEEPARQFKSMLASAELASPDPLGIGGLLCDAHRVAQLIAPPGDARTTACWSGCSPRRSRDFSTTPEPVNYASRRPTGLPFVNSAWRSVFAPFSACGRGPARTV